MTPYHPRDDPVEKTAAAWLARCDRALTPAEQDAFFEWLRADPRHSEAIARLKNAWSRLDTLGQRQPSPGARPNPDLLAPARRRWWTRAPALAMAAVLALAVGLTAWVVNQPPAGDFRGARVLPGPERVALEDGSLIELNAGAKVDVQFTVGERRVRLAGGEALFTLAKDPDRPFIVEARGCAVRALGTAFCVQLRDAEMAVLVTEGVVCLDEARTVADGAQAGPPLVPHLTAGQQAIVTTAARGTAALEFRVRELTPAEIDAALAWCGIRLEFDDLPLCDVVVEFNRYNVRQLVIETQDTGAIVVGGSFRADNLDAFVRLLDSGFDVSAETRGREIVLRRRH